MLDSNSAEAHTSLAHAKATQDWDWQGAEHAFRRAMALDPRYATAPHWYSTSVLVPTGRIDEAISRMRLAQSLEVRLQPGGKRRFAAPVALVAPGCPFHVEATHGPDQALVSPL